MKVNLSKLGEHDVILPKSIAVCLDFVAIWGSEPNRAQLGRLCAAAIAVGVDHTKCLPAYPIQTGDPIQFGFKIMERLLEAGVTPASIYEQGSNILVEMWKTIPTEEDVENTANFS